MAVFSPNSLFPSKKWLFADARDVWNYVRVPLNPEQLPIDLSVNYGEQNPIGWSQSLQQYGYTQTPSFPIDLTYSMQTAERLGMSKEEFEKGYMFFLSFCYPRRRGEDPSELFIVVPNTARLLTRVHSCRITFAKWTVSMQLREYQVALQLKIVGETFRNAANVRKYGYGAVDTKIASEGVLDVARTANAPLLFMGSDHDGD